VRYVSDGHEVEDKNDDAVGNRYADVIGVGQEALFIVECQVGGGEISCK
jgi:hypothetical protein